jgi:hypothetical protein
LSNLFFHNFFILLQYTLENERRKEVVMKKGWIVTLVVAGACALGVGGAIAVDRAVPAVEDTSAAVNSFSIAQENLPQYQRFTDRSADPDGDGYFCPGEAYWEENTRQGTYPMGPGMYEYWLQQSENQ